MQRYMWIRPISRNKIRGLAVTVWVLAMAAAVSAQTIQPPGATKKKKTAPKRRVVQFETADGVMIEGDYYPPVVDEGEKAPVAILVHMYPADRKSWKKLVPKLRKAGLAVLAYDIRGHGGSTEPAEKNLKTLYDGRDSDHFKSAWQDAAAAKAWLEKQPECDVSRLAMIGASIGCSISLDYGSRDKAVKAIVCLSPGTDYFGVDSKAHIKKCGKRRILLISPEGEYKAVKKLIKASDGIAKGKRYPGGNEQHGTHMLHEDYGHDMMQRIVDFVAKPLKVEKETETKPAVGE